MMGDQPLPRLEHPHQVVSVQLAPVHRRKDHRQERPRWDAFDVRQGIPVVSHPTVSQFQLSDPVDGVVETIITPHHPIPTLPR
jgi:hypothetical protein